MMQDVYKPLIKQQLKISVYSFQGQYLFSRVGLFEIEWLLAKVLTLLNLARKRFELKNYNACSFDVTFWLFYRF